jgi:dolichol-phosphate mannosyltransferase
MQRVVILIPTYNEVENAKPLVADILKNTHKLKNYKFTILFVDDNSPDGTGEVIAQLQQKDKNIELLKGKKKGLGVAMIRGYLYAMKNLKADIVVSNEADFAFDFKHLPFMLKQIKEGSDVVVGSRHVGVGKTEGWTLSRRLNHWVANKFFATWIAGVTQVYDHNGAYRAIRVKGVLDKIDWKNLQVTGFGFFFYSLYKLTTVTDKIVEFPVIYRFRTRGESKVSFNAKYLRSYLHDILEYARIALIIRAEKLK